MRVSILSELTRAGYRPCAFLVVPATKKAHGREALCVHTIFTTPFHWGVHPQLWRNLYMNPTNMIRTEGNSYRTTHR